MTSAGERRKHKRIGYDMPLALTKAVMEFGTLQRHAFTGTGIDISEEGLCFATKFGLTPGDFIEIRRGDSCQTAEVRWVGLVDGVYRVGVLIYQDQ